MNEEANHYLMRCGANGFFFVGPFPDKSAARWWLMTHDDLFGDWQIIQLTDDQISVPPIIVASNEPAKAKIMASVCGSRAP